MGSARHNEAGHLQFEGTPPAGVSGTLSRLERQPERLVLYIAVDDGETNALAVSPQRRLPERLVAELRSGRELRLTTRLRPPGPSHRLEVYADGRLQAVATDDRGRRPAVLGSWRWELADRAAGLEVRLQGGGERPGRAVQVGAATTIAAEGGSWHLHLLGATGAAANPRGVGEEAPRVSWVLYPATD